MPEEVAVLRWKSRNASSTAVSQGDVDFLTRQLLRSFASAVRTPRRLPPSIELEIHLDLALKPSREPLHITLRCCDICGIALV